MTASAFLSTQLFKVFEDAADDITWITLPLYVFVFAMSTMVVLGGCIGFVMGKRQRCSHIFSAEKDGAREVNEPGTSGYHDEPNKDCGDNKLLAFYGMSQNNEEAEEDEEDLDGPTMVLRGSLDLMASKWGTDGKKNETRLQRRGSENECKHISSSASKRSSAVVEYLSPERMSELLFSKVNCDGSNVGTTLCLDEYDPSRSSCNDTYSDSDEDEDITPSPKSSAIDIVSLLSPVGKSFNKSSNKSISTKEGKEGEDSTAKGSTASTLTPSAFIHLLSQIQRYSVDTSHPYFFNQLFGSLDPIALAAEIVALSVNTSVYTYETAPVFTLMEREVMGQIGKLVFGRKNEQEEEEEEFEGEGLMIPGGSLANLTAMHAARHRWKVMNGYTQKDGAANTASETMDDEYYSSGMEQEEEKKMEDPDPLPLSREDKGHALEQSQQSVAHLYNYDRASTTPDLVAFVSSEAHYSFAKSARVLGLREDDLIVIPTHSDGRMDVSVLAKRIEELENEFDLHCQGSCGGSGAASVARKRVPFFVACTAGSTVRGSFDDIAEIVKVCRDYESRGNNRCSDTDNDYTRSIWVHVDGAWGGSAIFSTRPEVRSSTHMDDIRHADSFTFNPHKMLGAPQQTTAFIVRHRNALRDANAAGAKYLFDPGKNGAEYDLGDLSYTCGRRTDAVKLWALWKYYGRAGLGRRVDQKVDELELFVGEMRKRVGRFALACKPWPFNVNFFYFPPRIRRVLDMRGLLSHRTDGNDDDYIQIPEDMSEDLAKVSVSLKLRLHEAGEMIIPYQPLNNQKADCFRFVLAGKKDFGIEDIRHVLNTMEKYGADL